MSEINDLNITDASNTDRFPENQAPSTVNNGARALEGILARHHKDTNASKASTGSANAYVFAADQTLSAYYDGLEISFDANFTNTDAVTLNVDSVGADDIKKYLNRDLDPGDIPSGQKVNVIHDGTNWQIMSPVPPYIQETVINTTSGTSHTFNILSTGIKKITGVLRQVSTNGTNALTFQVGDATAWTTAGYDCTLSILTTTVSTSRPTGYFQLTDTITAGTTVDGIFTLANTDANRWAFSANIALTSSDKMHVIAGSIDNTDPITRVRLANVGLVDTFDAGKFNIFIE